jgi:hypothetical protein
MALGDVGPYDGLSTADRFIEVQIAAEENPKGLLMRNQRLKDFLEPELEIQSLPTYSFFPPALKSRRRARVVSAIKTGGRTFLLNPESAIALGIPAVLSLDLAKAGWGSGRLELRPEVKGAGCFFDQTSIDAAVLESILGRHSGLRSSFQRWASSPLDDTIFASLALIEGRSAGGQEPSFGIHAVRSSTSLLGTSKVKFIPTLECVQHSTCYARHLRLISQAVRPGQEIYSKQTVSEIRYTAGSVRAVYFENASSDAQLVALCGRVSSQLNELRETLASMLEDIRHYLELMATSTHSDPEGGFSWEKVGDISLVFRRDRNGDARKGREYKNLQRRAWYLAKDEIIVRKIGKLFTDMESFRVSPSSYRARNAEELWFQHELFVLNVLRDHARVCVQFLLGLELKAGSRCCRRSRKDLQTEVMRELIAAANQSPCVHIELTRNIAEVEIYYSMLGYSRRYRFIRGQLGERYD